MGKPTWHRFSIFGFWFLVFGFEHLILNIWLPSWHLLDDHNDDCEDCCHPLLYSYERRWRHSRLLTSISCQNRWYKAYRLMMGISPCYMEVGAWGVLLATLVSEVLLIGKNPSYCSEYATEAMHDFQHISVTLLPFSTSLSFPFSTLINVIVVFYTTSRYSC